jgi:hypothetical protein
MKQNNHLQTEEVTTIDHQNSQVILPYGEKQFHDFLKGLLGEPEKISRRLHGIYDIELDDIMHLYSLLDQRIKQQNKSELISFSAVIFSEEDIYRNYRIDHEYFEETENSSITINQQFPLSIGNQSFADLRGL